MKKQWSASALIFCFAWLAPGCQSPETIASRNILKIRLEAKSIDGQQRLFSTMGFWLCNDALRERLVAAYRPDGTLDRVKLRGLIPEAKVTDSKDYIRVEMPSGPVRELMLTDQWLVSVDPKFDNLIQETAEAYERGRGRSPIVIIPQNLK